MKVRAYYDHYNSCIGINVSYEKEGKTFVAEPVEFSFKEVVGRYVSAGPTIRLNDEGVEMLAHSLKQLGVKDKEQSFIEGKLEATEKHLEDMRTISKVRRK